MKDLETIEIPISKKKLTLLFIAALGFVTAGAFFVLEPSTFLSPVARSSTKIFIGGCASILFFGYVGIFICKKLFDRAPGLIISREGITDNSNAIPAGFIPWSDITAVDNVKLNYSKLANQRFINLKVKNQPVYIQRQKGAFKKWMMKKNFNMYNGITISANGLKISNDELYDILQKRFAGHK